MGLAQTEANTELDAIAAGIHAGLDGLGDEFTRD